MKIAHISPHWSPYQANRLMGIKRIISNLSREQIKRGHDVTIIAPKGSIVENQKLIETIEPLSRFNINASDPKSLYYGIVHASLAAKQAKDFDVLHSHIEQVFLPFISMIHKPVVSTIHGTAFNSEEEYILRSYKDKFYSVAISKTSELLNKDIINFNNQIYNGIDLENWEAELEGEFEYMLYVGRINPRKGVVESTKVANLVHKKLRIFGFKEIGFENYFNELMRDSDASEFITYEGEMFDNNTKHDLYANAKIFLFPVMYEETFASTPLESMASGTPVVAFARGSLPEQVVDGETGFLVNPSNDDIRGDYVVKQTGVNGLVEAVHKVYSLTPDEYLQMRQKSRKHVEENFTTSVMVNKYEDAYSKIVGGIKQ